MFQVVEEMAHKKLAFIFLSCSLILICLTPLLVSHSSIPYEPIIRRLHLYVHETGNDYAYPDPHVMILNIIYPQNGPLMVFLGFEDLEDLTSAQYNDCFLNLEYANGKYYIEGRFTGAYHKTLWFNRPTKGRLNLATYFNQVWWSCAYDSLTEEFEFGEYWK